MTTTAEWLVQQGPGAFIAAGVAWGTIKATLGATVKSTQRIESKLDVLIRDIGKVAERVARLEGQHDPLER